MSRDHNDLRELLLDTIQGVSNGKIDPARGRTIAELSKALIQVERLGIDLMKIQVPAGANKLTAPKRLQIESAPPPPDDADDERDIDDDEVADDEESDDDEVADYELHENICVLLGRDGPLSLDDIAYELSAHKAEVRIALSHKDFKKTDEGYGMRKPSPLAKVVASGDDPELDDDDEADDDE